jgi:hypothetical protein
MIFLWITMNFQSSYKINTNQSREHYSYEFMTMQIGPWTTSNSRMRSLARLRIEEALELVWEAGRVDAHGEGRAAEVQGAHTHSREPAARHTVAWGGQATSSRGGEGSSSDGRLLQLSMAWVSVHVRCSTTRRRRWCTWLRPWGLGAVRTRVAASWAAGHGGRGHEQHVRAPKSEGESREWVG